MQKIIQSSSNPENISLTVKSLLLALVPVILILSKQLFSYDLSEKDLLDAITVITTFIASAGVVYGLIRKIYYKIK